MVARLCSPNTAPSLKKNKLNKIKDTSYGDTGSGRLECIKHWLKEKYFTVINGKIVSTQTEKGTVLVSPSH